LAEATAVDSTRAISVAGEGMRVTSTTNTDTVTMPAMRGTGGKAIHGCDLTLIRGRSSRRRVSAPLQYTGGAFHSLPCAARSVVPRTGIEPVRRFPASGGF
jgi:hypothetical protein